MNTHFPQFTLGIIIFLLTQNGIKAQLDYNQQWPGFRGPWGCGFITKGQTPTSWNIDSSQHIKWKTPIPGLGHSCPIIWDNYLFVSTATSGATEEPLKVGLYGDIDEADDNVLYEFKVYCLDKNTGKILWEKVAHKGNQSRNGIRNRRRQTARLQRMENM
jgi:outer membrane protein assembly factor BamB